MVYKSNNKDRYCILFTNKPKKTNVAYGLQIKQQRQILQIFTNLTIKTDIAYGLQN